METLSSVAQQVVLILHFTVPRFSICQTSNLTALPNTLFTRSAEETGMKLKDVSDWCPSLSIEWENLTSCAVLQDRCRLEADETEVVNIKLRFGTIRATVL